MGVVELNELLRKSRGRRAWPNHDRLLEEIAQDCLRRSNGEQFVSLGIPTETTRAVLCGKIRSLTPETLGRIVWGGGMKTETRLALCSGWFRNESKTGVRLQRALACAAVLNRMYEIVARPPKPKK